MTTARSHLFIMSALVVIALGGYAWWYRSVVRESSTLTALREQVAANEDGGTSSLTRSTRSRLEAGEQLVARYLIAEDEVPAFIDDLEARGRAQGAEVTVASVGASGAGSEAGLALSLSIEGGFASVMRTLGAIEHAPYAITLSSVTVGYDFDGSWRADLKLDVRSSFTP